MNSWKHRALVFLTTSLAVLGAPVAPAPAQEGNAPTMLDNLLETGRNLFEEYAPAEVKEQYEFPDRGRVESFLADLDRACEEGSFQELAAYVPAARQALTFLRSIEGGDELADWLEPELDLLVAAGDVAEQQAVAPPAPQPAPAPRARPQRPGETATPAPAPSPAPKPAAPPSGSKRPSGKLSREYWQQVMAQRPAPERARDLVPSLKRIFQKAGVAPEWVWLAEVESSMNPKARSPVGARGLFQFMPATAERFGLKTSLPDERTDPAKSAGAAAEYLKYLHKKFQSWPLAVAAYNAGEGRVGRLLTGDRRDFDAIQPLLPAETQLYVPKVLGTVAVREGVDPERLPAPAVAAYSPDQDNILAASASGTSDE